MKVRLTFDFSDYDLKVIGYDFNCKDKADRNQLEAFAEQCVSATLEDKRYDYEQHVSEDK